MKKTVTVLFLVIFLSLSVAEIAVAGNSTVPPAPSFLSFTPPASDVSLTYLKTMFGLVDGVLHSSGSQLLGKLFKIFNLAVLSIGGIVLMYTFIVSTINTAQEGEVMGKKWSSIWIPLRSVIGIALLIPKASGYSMIQILVMWIVVQGIGAADSIWNTALNYLGNGGVIITPSQSADTDAKRQSFNKILDFTGDALQQMVCVYAVQNELEKARAANPNSRAVVPDFLNNTVPFRSMSQTFVLVPTFPSVGPPPYVQYENVCGAINWNAIIAPQGQAEVQNARSYAVQQVLLTLAAAARPIVYSNGKNANDDDYYANAILNAALDYQAIVTPALQVASGKDDRFSKEMDRHGGSFNRPRDWMTEMKRAGWVMAGTYFEVITRQQEQNQQETSPPSVVGQGYEVINRLKLIDPSLFTDWSTPSVNIWNRLEATRGAVERARGKANNAAGRGNQDADPLAELNRGGIVGLRLKSFLSSFQAVNSDAGVDTSNPITALVQQGKGMMIGSAFIWSTISATSMTITAALAVVPFVSLGTFMNAVNQWMVPIVTGITGLCITTGATLAYYIPMLPFFIFTLAVIGWVVGVFEAIVAAPLVALALMHPEGDETFGKATPAIMMILNIFLKPMLIIIGYIGAIMVIYVGIWLLNKGFDTAWHGALTLQNNEVLKTGMGSFLAGFGVVAAGIIPPMIIAQLPGMISLFSGLILLVTSGLVMTIIKTTFAVYIVQKVLSIGISGLPGHLLAYVGLQTQDVASGLAGGAEQGAEQKAEGATGKLGGTSALGGAQRGIDYDKGGKQGGSQKNRTEFT